MPLLQSGSAVGALVAFGLGVAAMATPGWVYVSGLGTEVAIGLFYTDEVNNNDFEEHYYLTVTATSVCICCMSFGLAFLLIGAIGNLTTGNIIREKRLAKVGGILGFTAGLIMGAGMSTLTGLAMTSNFYKNYVDTPFGLNYAWGYSFYLGWSAVGVSLISGIVGLCGKPPRSEVYPA